MGTAMGTGAGKRRLFFLRLGLVVTGCLLPVVCLEIWFRVQAWRGDRAEREAWNQIRGSATTVPATGEALFFQLVRTSPHEDIVYQLKPHLDVTFGGVPVTTDARGWRQLPSLPGMRPGPNRPAVRIVGLGDSFMFGWAVAAQDCYLAHIRRSLQAAHPHVDWQITNTAVPGYNTVMEVATLRHNVSALQPDLVILGFVGNDLDLPHFIHETEDYLSLSRSFLLEHLARTLVRAERVPARPLVAASGLFEGHRAPEDLPREYRHLVGPGPFAAALAELADLSRRHGFQVLVVAHTLAQHDLSRLCRQHGLDLLECGPRLEEYMQEHGIASYLGSVLTVSKTDPHPSSLGHRLMAQAIYQRLQPRIARLVAEATRAGPGK